MGSSFDQYTEQEQQSLLESAAPQSEDVFISVSRLYCAYKVQNLRMHGATQCRNGEAVESPIDFLISTEIVSKRVLSLREYVLWQKFSMHSPEAVEKLLPPATKKLLAKEWQGVFYGYPKLFKRSMHAWKVEELRTQRRAKVKAEAELLAQQVFSNDSEQQEEVDSPVAIATEMEIDSI